MDRFLVKVADLLQSVADVLVIRIVILSFLILMVKLENISWTQALTLLELLS